MDQQELTNGNLSKIEDIIKTRFKERKLLLEALTHRSYLNERPSWTLPHNERLEYLGDAVLELVVSRELFEKFPTYPEGQLTVLRAALVNSQTLARVAEELKLDDFMLMSRGERKDVGKAREAILANAIEALIGAIYLDGNIAAAQEFILQFIFTRLDEILKTKSYRDSKSELQEIVQERRKVTPTYRVLEESGPAHRKLFTVGVFFAEDIIAKGDGASKQEAEIDAAKNALLVLKR